MEEKNIIHCKVVFLGDSGTNKTEIIKKYWNNHSDIIDSPYYIKKEFFEDENKTISFDMWDTAGKEKYKCLTKFFYKDADVIILVYDVAIKSTFENLKNFWFEQIKEICKQYFGKYINK